MPYIQIPGGGVSVANSFLTTPYQIPGLVYYLNPDTYNLAEVAWSMNSNKVITAVSAHNADKTVDSSKNVTQSTDSKRPTLNIADAAYGGRNTLSFSDAASQYLVSSAWASTVSVPFTVYTVAESSGGTASPKFILDGNTVNNRFCIYQANPGGLMTMFNGVNLSSSVTSDGLGSSVYCGVFNGASSEFYERNPSAPIATGNTGSQTLSGITVGCAYTLSGNMWNGKIACILVYSGAHTLAQRTTIMNYLNDYYGFNRSLAPYTIGGFAYWLDPDRYNDGAINWTLNASKVATATSRHSWTATADTSKNTTNATDSQRPTINVADAAFNNKNTLTFDKASTQYLGASGAWTTSLAQPWTAYVVASVNNGSTQRNLFASPASIVHAYTSGLLSAYAGVNLFSSARVDDGYKRIFSISGNGASSSIYINNPSAVDVTGNASAGAISQVGIGGSSTSNTFDGKIATVLLYSGTHTDAQRSIVMNYLSSKYGITISDPYSVPGLVYWLDPDRYSDWTLNGNKVASATSKESYAGVIDASKTATQASDALRPTLNIADPAFNNKNTLSFSAAATQYLGTPAWGSGVTHPVTTYVVVSVNSFAAARTFMDATGAPSAIQTFSSVTNGYVSMNSNGSQIANANGAIAAGTGYVLASTWNGGSSSLYLSNSTTAAYTGTLNSSTVSNLRIGASYSTNLFHDGKIAAILVYSGAHTQAQRNIVMSYLATKYNLTYTP